MDGTWGMKSEFFQESLKVRHFRTGGGGRLRVIRTQTNAVEEEEEKVHSVK